jgi:cellulose synthase/poly-beta-1,6-N-acetylglucosamine synthase-like glycosyltransferase
VLERLRLLRCWEPVFHRLRIDADRAALLAERASENRSDVYAELRASGLVSDEDLLGALAAELGLRFLETLRPGQLVIEERQAVTLLHEMRRRAVATLLEPDGDTILVMAPMQIDLAGLKGLLMRKPQLARRLALATPGELRRALLVRAEPLLMREAAMGLFDSDPEMSARFVTNAWQVFAVGLLVAGLPLLLAVAPLATALGASAILSSLFVGCIGLRIAAALSSVGTSDADVVEREDDADLPVYTVVVALYREAEVVPDLLLSLGRLDWPRSKLEVKLVCEADDAETLAAVERHALRSWVEVVRVPPGMPRTKPKALNHVLPTCSGEVVALFDAEDRPHPQQLRAAWRALCEGGEGLACVQAPLRIANGRYGLLPWLFRAEYAAHFRGLLPWLARRDLLIPLGGTSNHFRRSDLIEIGAWDPHNVTEDADLGVRFRRRGLRVGTIAPPTLEDAPEDFMVWLRQRTRWYKGWIQTWLVHMRAPLRLYRELGPGSFAVFQFLFGGLIASAVFHPVLLATALGLSGKFALWGDLQPREELLLFLSLMNIVGGYGSYLLLAFRCVDPPERRDFWKIVAATPVYWMLMSAAGYRAIWQLVRRPHHWEKTPHRRFRRPEPTAAVLARTARAPATPPALPARSQAPTMSGPAQTILSSSLPITSSSRPS